MAGHVFWSYRSEGTTRGIARAPREGGAVEILRAEGRPSFMCVVAPRLYWCEESSGTIGRMNLDGTDADPAWLAPPALETSRPESLTSDGTHLFIARPGASTPTIARLLLNGSEYEEEWLPAEAQSVLVHGEFIYWINADFIGRARLDLSVIEPEWVAFASSESTTEPRVLVTDGTHLIWSNSAPGTGEFFGRVLLTGGSLEEEWKSYNSTALAADAGKLYCAGAEDFVARGTFAGVIEREWQAMGESAAENIEGLAVTESSEEKEGEGGGGEPARSVLIRERPATRLSVLVQPPTGTSWRWGEDDPNPLFSPGQMTFGTAMPGGFDRFSCVLQRDPTMTYPDLAVMAKVTAMGNGGTTAWQGRLEKLPDVAGYQSQVTPEAVGYQAALEDDNTAREIFIDQEQSRWEAATLRRQINLVAAGRTLDAPTTAVDPEGGTPSVVTSFTTPYEDTPSPISEAWYDAKGIPIAKLAYAWQKGENIDTAWTDFGWQAFLSSDDIATSVDETADLFGPGPGAWTVLAATALRTWAMVQESNILANADQNVLLAIYWQLAVYGAHNLPLYGPQPQGVYASDVVRYAIQKWAPEIATSGIVGSSFVIPQLAFTEPTTVAEILKQATRFELPDWAIWEGPIMYLNPRGERGNQWKARVGPAQLQEAGPQISRLWNGVAVQYTDVTGITRMVGPPGYAGAEPGSEDLLLLDIDPLNPLNVAGIKKWALLTMGTSTPEGAKAVGRTFLAEQKALSTSGQASIVGYAENLAGAFLPAWSIRAGDEISFVDASIPGPRRIVSTSYDHSTRTNTLQLDQPPEGMQALLERLSVVLSPIGFT